MLYRQTNVAVLILHMSNEPRVNEEKTISIMNRDDSKPTEL